MTIAVFNCLYYNNVRYDIRIFVYLWRGVDYQVRQTPDKMDLVIWHVINHNLLQLVIITCYKHINYDIIYWSSGNTKDVKHL